MGLFAFLLLGLIAGWLANAFMGKGSLGLVGNMVVGVIGASIGGFLMNIIGGSGVTGFNVYSIFISALGAALLIFVVRKISN